MSDRVTDLGLSFEAWCEKYSPPTRAAWLASQKPQTVHLWRKNNESLCECTIDGPHPRDGITTDVLKVTCESCFSYMDSPGSHVPEHSLIDTIERHDAIQRMHIKRLRAKVLELKQRVRELEALDR